MRSIRRSSIGFGQTVFGKHNEISRQRLRFTDPSERLWGKVEAGEEQGNDTGLLRLYVRLLASAFRFPKLGQNSMSSSNTFVPARHTVFHVRILRLPEEYCGEVPKLLSFGNTIGGCTDGREEVASGVDDVKADALQLRTPLCAS